MADNNVLSMKNPPFGTDADSLDSALYITAVSVRVGPSKLPLGYVQSIKADGIGRKVSTVRQLEAYPNTVFNVPGGAFSTPVAGVVPFSSDLTYFPGEAVEVVPGPMDGDIKVTLKRVTLFTSNILEAAIKAGILQKSVTDSNALSFRIVNVLQQTRPFSIYELWVSPKSDRKILYGIEYQDCWFQAWDKEEIDVSRGGEAMIVDTATVIATRIRPYTG